jgi:GYF domain 2
MADRSWFYASEGQQKGPFSEVQLRDLITRGTVRADTLVWTEGMAGWQRAGEIPGLMSVASGPPSIPRAGGPTVAGGRHGGGALSIDLPIWSFLGQTIVYVIGMLLVIPAPWAATGFNRWMISRINVPGRPNFAFTGQVGDIWYVFVAVALLIYVEQADNYLPLIGIVVQAFLQWMIIRWIASHLSSNGEPLPIAFTGSVWTYIGWQVLMVLSFLTIIGWAWVVTAWTRWICRNISGTRREIIFNASGLDVLWRTVVLVIGCAFLIPIPWVIRWYATWIVSQFALAEHGAYANA